MQYCPRCGNAIEDKAVFCTVCGQKTGISAENDPNSTNLAAAPRRITYARQPEPLDSTGNRQVWWIAGIVGGLILAGGGTFFVMQAHTPAPGTQIVQKAQPQTPAPSQPAQGAFKLPGAPGTNAAVAEFRTYVEAKERLNTEIVDLASQVNSRLSQAGTLRYSQDLRNKARLIIEDIARYSSTLAGKNYPAEFQNSKSLLLRLYDLETTRARSLYNGLLEGINGQDFQSSFAVGTKAAYEFDDLNARFLQEYNSLETL